MIGAIAEVKGKAAPKPAPAGPEPAHMAKPNAAKAHDPEPATAAHADAT